MSTKLYNPLLQKTFVVQYISKPTKGAEMSDIIKSKGWDWKQVQPEQAEPWKKPAVESFYLINRWKSQDKTDFLDLGCGLGRHTILFAQNSFKTFAFDISKDAIKHTQNWANQEELKNIHFAIGDMLALPYASESMDCILCRNAISHTNTNGMLQIVSELSRILRVDGECYLTLGSKNEWIEQNWPKVDENTYLCMDKQEFEVPHFYADYDLIQDLFKDFQIELLEHIGTFKNIENHPIEVRHFHLLIKKKP